MIKLKAPTNSNLLKFKLRFKEYALSKLEVNGKIGSRGKNFIEGNLDSILISNPRELIRLQMDFYQLVLGDINDFNEYLDIKRKPRHAGRKLDIFEKYNNLNKELVKIFDYGNLISNNKENSYWLAKLLNVNTCAYCNRLYTTTVIENNEKKISRPQFDHWYAKSKYPLLSLSFYNLIPSCSICNSSFKGEKIFDLDSHIHPYILDDEESNENFKFSYKKKSLLDNNVILKYAKEDSKTENTFNDFKIEQMYNSHSEFELKDLLDLRYKYPDNYIKILFEDTFENLEISKQEAYILIFGTELDESNFHKRPFSKFKSDLLKELGINDI